MAALLAQHRSPSSPSSSFPQSDCGGTLLPPVPERTLLRDILYIFQGIDGQFIRFRNPLPSRPGPRRTYVRGEIVTDSGGVIDPGEGEEEREEFEDGIEFVELRKKGYSLSAPTRTLLHQLSELGWLYRKIEMALLRSEEGRSGSLALRAKRDHKGKKREKENSSQSQPVGMVEQSLHAELQNEMTGYFELVAKLEGKLEGVEDEEEQVAKGEKGEGSRLCEIEGLEGALTLRKLDVWTQDVRLRMRMMGTLVSEVGGQFPSPPPFSLLYLTDGWRVLTGLNVGGAFLTTLHAYTANGDPFIRTFSSRLLKTLSIPFFSTLSSWIYQGELRDPYNEFFVSLNPALGNEGDERWKKRGGNGIDGELWGNSFDDRDADGGVPSHELWAEKFSFRKEMLPGFLEESFGRKVSLSEISERLVERSLILKVHRSSRPANHSTS